MIFHSHQIIAHLFCKFDHLWMIIYWLVTHLKILVFHPQIVNTISHKCIPVNETKIVQKWISVQIVQEKLFNVIRIKHCFLAKLSFICYCGTFSYSSLVKNGFSKRVSSITRQQCYELHHLQTFNYNGFLATGIPPNDRKTVRITEIWSIDFEGNCNGASFLNKQGTYKN